ncbi:DNA helicase [Tanacetum coccineum]
MKCKRKLLPKTNNAKQSENRIPTFISKEQTQCGTPSYADTDDESAHFYPLVASSEAIRQVVNDQLCGEAPLSNSRFHSPFQARYSSDSLEVGNYSNFHVVQQSDFAVFRKYSKLCQRKTRAIIGTLYVDVVHTTNVRNSQTISDESLRLNLSEEVVDTRLPESTIITFSEDDKNNTTSPSPFISEGSGCIGVSFLNPCKRTHRNVTSEESPSKRTQQTTLRFTNTLLVAVTHEDGEGCSSGRLEDCGHIGDSALSILRNRRVHGFVRDNGEGYSSGQTKGRSYTYTDLGDYHQQCHHCEATFWFGECLKGHSNFRMPEYHLCCEGGRIYMEPDPDPPEEVYHWIGSLCPLAGEPPRFLQLYIYDTENEVENKMRNFGGIDDSNLDSEIVEGLVHFLDVHNELVQLFRIARDKCREIGILEFKIRLYNAEGARDYELSTSNTLGAVVFYSGVTGSTNFDVIIQEKDGPAKRTSKLHNRNERQVTMRAYYAYQLHPWDFIRKKQSDIRSDYLSGLYDVISRGERDGFEVGGRIILPMSFTKGPRYMYVHYLDALAICQKLVLYTVEFQKRGLPHCHTLLWVDSESNIQGPEDVRLDNSYVVPYNRDLLLAFEAHINVEYCGWSMLIKYIFKYISKGRDKIFARVSRPLGESANAVGPSRPPIDEIQNYLKGRFRVTFRGRDRLESVVNLPNRKNTTLTEWLAYNEANEDGRHLTYLDFPSEFVWYDNHKSWSPRQNSRSSFGRFAYVHPTSGELFYFRMLLYHQKGCKDFFEVQTVHDIFYPTYRAACEALGLLGDDNKWDIAMQEVCLSATSSQLRFVFAHILTHCEVTNPLKLWTKYWTEMSHDILKRVSEMTHIPNYHLNDDSLQGYIFHGCTGKTFLWKTIISTLRCKGKIVLAAASSSIASLLLPSSQIAHSRFKLPIELTEESLCKVTKNSQLGKLLADTDLIIWDEAPMNDRRFYYFRRRDFRQTLPVKKGASKMEIIASCISQSEMWLHFKVFILKENMRLPKPDVSADERNLISSFASWLLDIGDGKTGEPDKEDPKNTNWIHIPLTYCLPDTEQGLSKLIDFIYDKMTLRTPSIITLQKKAIVCPKNESADMINSKVLEMVQGEMTTYLSHDEAIPPECDGANTEMLYHVEHLNTLKFPGFPPHRLELKMGAPVMLLRNVNVAGGLYNGTRMIVRQMMTKLIEVQIITGNRVFNLYLSSLTLCSVGISKRDKIDNCSDTSLLQELSRAADSYDIRDQLSVLFRREVVEDSQRMHDYRRLSAELTDGVKMRDEYMNELRMLVNCEEILERVLK